MKRTQLKRGGSIKKSKSINKVSTKEKERQKIYAEQRKKDEETEQACKRCGVQQNLQRHHPDGRSDILNYFYLCFTCHHWVHENPDKARKQNFLV